MGRRGEANPGAPRRFQLFAEGIGRKMLGPEGAVVQLLWVGGRSNRDPWLCWGRARGRTRGGVKVALGRSSQCDL